MSVLRDILGGHQVISFTVLTFLFSWYFWSAAAWVPESSALYVAVGGLGPSIVGLALIWFLNGREGVSRTLSRLIPGDVSPLWFMFALVGGLLLVLPGTLLSSLLGGASLAVSDLYKMCISFASVLFFSVVGEEIGWRGFVLPRIQRDAVAAVSGLVVGVLWGVWQIPLWYVSGHPYQSFPLPVFLAYVAGVSVICTWLYNNTRGNLLVVSLFHAASYAAFGALPMLAVNLGWLPMLVSAATVWVAVGVVVIVYGPTYLSRDERYSFLGGFSWDYEE